MVTRSTAEPFPGTCARRYCLRGTPELRWVSLTEGLGAVVNGDAGPTPSWKTRPSLLLRYDRPVMAGLLLMLVIIGIGAAGPAAGSQGPWHQHALIIGAGLEAALAALVIGLIIRGRHSSPADSLPAILRRDLRRITLAVMIAIVVFAGVSELEHSFGGARPHNKVLERARPKPFGHLPKLTQAGSVHLGYLLYALLVLVLLAALVVCAILIARMRPRGAGGYVGEAEDESASLRQAVESGRTAAAALHCRHRADRRRCRRGVLASSAGRSCRGIDPSRRRHHRGRRGWPGSSGLAGPQPLAPRLPADRVSLHAAGVCRRVDETAGHRHCAQPAK
jgi:hypothetical protein